MNTPKAIASIFEYINKTANLKTITKSDATLITKIIKESLDILGIKITIKPAPKTIKDLVKKRELSRKTKDFKTADQIRDKIESQGFYLDDTKNGPVITHNNFIYGQPR